MDRQLDSKRLYKCHSVFALVQGRCRCPLDFNFSAAASDVCVRADQLGMATSLLFVPVIAAAGPAFLVWLFGGGFGLAIVVFILLKVLGK